MKVNQVPSTREEDRTEVLQEEEEEAIIKPAAEGTGIPYEARPSQSTIKPHYHNQDLPKPYPRNWYPNFLVLLFVKRQSTNFLMPF